MKIQVLFVLFAVFALAHCYPQKVSETEDPTKSNTPKPQSKSEGDGLIIESEGDLEQDRKNGDGGVFVQRVPMFYSPFFSNPFSGFFEDMMHRMREQMRNMFQQIPLTGLNINRLPGNTTSTTKVIDGHVVTINETTYKTGNDTDGGVFRVKVIDIKQKGAEGSTPQTREQITPTPRGVEPVERKEQPEENEIPKENQDVEESIEHRLYSREYPPETNEVEVFEIPQPIDMASDIRVNKLLSERGKAGGLVMVDPDAELIDVENGEVVKPYFPSQTRYRFQGWN